MQYESCRHVHPDGAFCGSPALRQRKYCYYHLLERARRLRRARALRDNQPYRLQLQSLDNPYAVRAALTEIFQALGTGQLDPRVAGKMLYAIQLVRAENKRIAQMEADADKNQSSVDPTACVQEYPDLERKLGLPPGADLDAEIAAVEHKAEAEVELRQGDAMPAPPPGMRPGSPAYRIYREEAYQIQRLQIKSLEHQLRDYHEQKRRELEPIRKEFEKEFADARKEFENAKKEAASATPSAQRRADSA